MSACAPSTGSRRRRRRPMSRPTPGSAGRVSDHLELFVAGSNLLHRTHAREQRRQPRAARRALASMPARGFGFEATRGRLALAACAVPGAGRRRRAPSRARRRSRPPSCPASRATSSGRAAAVPEPAAPFHLCVIGRDPFGRMLDQAAAGELIDGHGVAGPPRRLGRAERRLPPRLRPGRDRRAETGAAAARLARNARPHRHRRARRRRSAA